MRASTLITVACLAGLSLLLISSSLARGEGANERNENLKPIYLPENRVFAAYVLRVQSNAELVSLERGEAVYSALLNRYGIDPKYRKEAIAGLAQLHGSDLPSEWIAALKKIDREPVILDWNHVEKEPTDEQTDAVIADFGHLLAQMPAEQLAAQRANIHALARESKRPLVRSLGYAALVSAGAGASEIWELARSERRSDAVRAIPWIENSQIQSELYTKSRPLSGEAASDQLRAAFFYALPSVPGHDEEIFATLRPGIENEQLRDVAVTALLGRDASKWPATELAQLCKELVGILKAMPLGARASSRGRRLVELATRTAKRLPDESRSAHLARISQLKVAQRFLGTLREQMAFDKEFLVVGAGQPIELYFTNNDGMPHNVVIGATGSLEELGRAADQMATSPEALSKGYLPESDKVLHHTRMLDMGQMQKLVFTAPDTPGVYPMLCTFPSHAMRMYAAFVVTDDVDGWLASQQNASRDKLLGIVTYDHDFDALAAELAKGPPQSSFARGQAAFESRSCVSCHSVRGKGGRVGPELTELAKENKPTDILRSLLFPSEKIDPNFAKVELEDLASGQIHLGVLIPQEDENILYLVDDPLGNCEPKIFNRDECVVVPLKVSPMPEELLRRSSPQEVMDLVGYLWAGGDPEHPIYQGPEK